MSNGACNGPCGPFRNREDGYKVCNKCGEVSLGDNMAKALAGVKELIGKGWEYCDAVETMAKGYHVDEMELENVWFNS